MPNLLDIAQISETGSGKLGTIFNLFRYLDILTDKRNDLQNMPRTF